MGGSDRCPPGKCYGWHVLFAILRGLYLQALQLTLLVTATYHNSCIVLLTPLLNGIFSCPAILLLFVPSSTSSP